MPHISVLMPAYNSEKYIKEAIESILTQSFLDFEFIIINDGSTDETEFIIKKFTDPRIKYIKNEINRGLIYTLNKGLELAQGKYIARMDADDISHPQRFQKQVDFLNVNLNVSLVGTAFSIIGTDKITHHPKVNDQIKIKLLTDTSLAHPSVMFLKDDFLKKRLFYDPTCINAEDYKLWTDVSIAGLKIANLDDVLLKYRIHETQISTAKVSEQYDSVKKIRKQYAKRIYNDTLNQSEYEIIKDGFRRHNPFEIILLLFKMEKLNKSSIHFFNDIEFNFFIQDNLNALMPVVGKYDVCHILFSKAPIKLKLTIINRYISCFLSKKNHL